MSGRRSYARFTITPSFEGVLRVLRDVTVRRADEGEFVVIGREAGVVGDVVTLEMAESESAVTLATRARVVESVPVILDGSVRHQLRLQRLSDGGPTGVGSHPAFVLGERR